MLKMGTMSTKYNINNKALGALGAITPQEENPTRHEGLEFFSQNSPR